MSSILKNGSSLISSNSLESINPKDALHLPSLSDSKSSSPNSKLDLGVGSLSHINISRRQVSFAEPKVKTKDLGPKTARPKSNSNLRLDGSEKDTPVPNQRKRLIGKQGHKAQLCKPPRQRQFKPKFKPGHISASADTEAASKNHENTSMSRQSSIVVLWDADNKSFSPPFLDVATSLKKLAGHFGGSLSTYQLLVVIAFSEIAPQEADAALQRAWEEWKMTRLEKEPDSFIWLILVSDDAGFRHMLSSSKRSGFGVVVVNEFITKLSLEGDFCTPWLQLKAGSHSLDGLVDHIVGISTMGRSWMRENMNTNDFADEGVIVQIVLKPKNQSLANKNHETGAIVENNAETMLEQHLKHAGDRHL
ncbi:hypothetical protein ACHAPF_011122 [Botrytis cinerea]